MKTKKIVMIIPFLFLSFHVGNVNSYYTIPQAPFTIFAADFNNDGDIDIFTGHNYSSNSNWGGISLLENDGTGHFSLIDSIFFENGFRVVDGNYFDNNDYIDIFGRTITNNPYTIYATIIYNYGLTQFDSIKFFPIYNSPPIPYITSGDVTGNGVADILFAHNNHQLWGIIYNDGSGNFSAPETFSLGFFPNGIACDDVTGNEKADIVLAGSYTIIIFSTETGFQQQVLGYTPSFSGGYTLLITDFDNDGDKDILVSVKYYNNHNRIYMFENLGGGQFLQHDFFEFTPFCSYAMAADFNNDSLPDLAFIASDNSGIHIYRNKGEFFIDFQQFISVETNNASLRHIDHADFDSNNYNDIVYIISWGAPFTGNLRILFNDGNGNFQEDPIISYQTLNFEPQTSNLTCYPNPFTTSVNIEFTLTEQIPVELTVFDLNGNHITTLIHKTMPPGGHTITWSGKDLNGKEVKPWIYLLGFAVNGQPNHTIKLIKM
jgi:hypothetical protein